MRVIFVFCFLIISSNGFSQKTESIPTLEGEKLKQFNEAKSALKELFRSELKQKVKKNPTNKEKLKKDYEKSYRDTLADLRRNFALGNIEIHKEWMFPGISGGTPTGSGMSWAQVAAWGVYTPKDLYSNMNDAGVGFSFGIGDPDKYIGMQNTFDFQDLYNRRNGKRFDLTKAPDFSIGAYHFSIHKNIPSNMAIGFAEYYVATYGYESQINIRRSESLALTKYWPRRLPHESFSVFQTSIGIGRGGGFVDDSTKLAKNGKIRSILAPFASIGVRALPPLGIGLEYGSKRINAFMNITPFRNFPLAFTLQGINLNGAGGYSKMLSISGSIFYDFAGK